MPILKITDMQGKLLVQLPIGHIGFNSSNKVIVYRGQNTGVFLNGKHTGISQSIQFFTDPYIDLGRLEIEFD